jgi:hypothetical protein
MFFIKRKSWLDQLNVSVSLRAQAKARYDRLQAGNTPNAQHRVEAWARNEQRKLAEAVRADPWAA